MIDEIEELWSLADECRAWVKGTTHPMNYEDVQLAGKEFARLAAKLDEIAKRLAARMPT